VHEKRRGPAFVLAEKESASREKNLCPRIRKETERWETGRGPLQAGLDIGERVMHSYLIRKDAVCCGKWRGHW